MQEGIWGARVRTLLAIVLIYPLVLPSSEGAEPTLAAPAAPTPAAAQTGLADLALASATEPPQIDAAEYEAARQELVASAHALDAALGRNTQLAQNWKKYLKWDLLEPQLAADAKVDRAALDDLSTVLRRFRANQPGLELPVFTRVAAALDRYREVAFWNTLSQRRDVAPIYESYLKSFAEQLRRHEEAPTMETTRQVGQVLGTLESLGDSPEIVQAVHQSYSRPNVWADISARALNNWLLRCVSCSRCGIAFWGRRSAGRR